MDRQAATVAVEPALTCFAERLRQEIDAERVLLFGSHARGQVHAQSDYDIIVVSHRFEGVERPDRGLDLRALWRDVGGDGPMDIICVTPEEFAQAQHQITLIAAVLPEAIDLLLPTPSAG